MSQQLAIRSIRTKQKLYDAYLRLLTKKFPSDITIQMLTKEASINRVTFYKHFRHIANFHQEFINHYILELYEFMKPLNYKEYSRGFEYDALLLLLNHIKDHSDTYKILLTSPKIEEFNQHMLLFFQRKITRHTTELAKFEFPGTSVDQVIVGWYGVSALFGTIIMWVQSDFPYSPEQLAQAMVKLTPSS